MTLVYVGVAVWLASGIAGIAVLLCAVRRAIDETDDYCSAVDVELTAAESRRRDRAA